METVNNNTNNNNMQTSPNMVNNSILTPPPPSQSMFLPPKNISLMKPPNILSSFPQPSTSDLITSSNPNKLLSQALAKPPSLNLVLNPSKPILPSPSQQNSNASTPNQAFLTMPKNVLMTNGSGSSQLNSPQNGSNLIAQSFKSSELTTGSGAVNSNASSKNSSTADLSSLVQQQHQFNNNQINFSNSMPTSSTAQIFSTLPAPTVLKQQTINSQSLTTSALAPQISNDLNTTPVSQPVTAPVSQSTTSYFQQQQQQQHPQTTINSNPSTYFQQTNTISAPSTADLFSNIKQTEQQKPATAPINTMPFFQPNNQLNIAQNINLFNNNQTNSNEPTVQSTGNYFNKNISDTNNIKTANYFPPPPSSSLSNNQPINPINQQQQQQQQQQLTAPAQPQQFYTPNPQQLPPQPPPTSQNGPNYLNNNMYYQPQQQTQPQQTPYLFNPSNQQQSIPPPPLNSYNNNNNNTGNLSIRPPPPPSTGQYQSSNQSNMSQPPPIYNNSTQSITNQMSNMNIAPSNTSISQSTASSSQLSTSSSQQSHSRLTNNNNRQNNYVNRSQPQSMDLLREKRLISEYPDADDVVRPQFPHEFYTTVNCHHDTIRCTLTSIPESQNLLSKCRLPLGILIHPFKDLESLKVVQSSTIVRCRSCRSYINPFVHFLDNSKWRCNMCYSINDLPDEFLFDPVTRSYGDPSKRPEINSSTIEFIAPAEYTLRPPPPAMYIYLLDVSHNAISTGYLHSFCETLLENLDKIPGDSRTQIGFITYNSCLHFYNLSDSLSQPRMMIYPDLDELVLPMPDNLMINLNENKESIQIFLQSLPSLFADSYETDSALGSALNAAHQLLKQTGGRITVMQTCLPNVGVGALKIREETIDKDSTNLGPQCDFYKKMALDCAGLHIAVDLFMFNSLYADLATLSCIAKYSGGEIKYYPGYHAENHPEQVIRFCVDFKRYLVRKIGFEAVMRIRCTRGLSIHTFHGNFFVRSTDLLALPNVNPDAGFGMQVSIEENLTDITTVCFQAAVLYTSSKGERRIRIHTYCLPVSKNLNELINGADQEAVIGLVAKMAVDRTSMNSLKEAKDALTNVAADFLQAYSQLIIPSHKNNALLSSVSLRLLPTYVLALMKNIAFKFGNVKMDDRVYAMNLHKTMPNKYLMLCIYPHLYAIHNLDDKRVIVDSSETEICIPPRLHLSSENIDRHGVYIMDAGEAIYMWIGRSVSDQFLQLVFDCRSFQELPDHSNDLPELDNILSERVRNFLVYLYDSRPFGPTFIYFREDSSKAKIFFQYMHDDKTESSLSYFEFLRHLNEQVNN